MMYRQALSDSAAQPRYRDRYAKTRPNLLLAATYGPAWMVKEPRLTQPGASAGLRGSRRRGRVRFVYLMTGVAHLAHEQR